MTVTSLKRHTISFKHALDGIFYTFKTQPNFRVHTFFAVAATCSGLFLKISPAEWSVIIFVIGLVIICEMINTSLESVTDLLTNQYHLSAKIAKDVSAGMVLVAAAIAVVTGLLIFTPHLWAFF